MERKKYELINMTGGTRMTINGEEDMAKTCSLVLQAFFDLEKEWKVDKTDRYSENDALMISGYENEDGNWMLVLLIAKEKADEDAEIYKEWESVN
ncbi:hypothetical protein AB1283_25985 [Bacillus sp. S13(2024)]|uniref:hypothetical protein n=1 Tax=Bacillus sp. S13(2024) TaxID=3162885 RepID=UPI003D19C828